MSVQTGMTDSDRLLELQKGGQAKADTFSGFQAAGAGSGGAAPAPEEGWVWGSLTGLLLPTQQTPKP